MNILALHVLPLAAEPEGWLRGVPFMMLQTFLLMSAAYFLGAFIGCMWRRVIHTAPDVSDIRSTEAAVAATPAPAPAATARVATAQPEVEYVAPKSGASDATRFERALSSAGTLTPAVTPPKPAAPAPVAPAAPVQVEAPKPMVAETVNRPAPAMPPKPVDTEPPTVISQTRPAERHFASPPASEAVSVAAAVAAAAAASAAMKTSARPAEVVKAPEPVTPKPAPPTVTVRPSTPSSVPPQPAPAGAVPAVPKPADPPMLPGVPAASGGGMAGAVAEVRIQGGPPADRQDLTLVRGIDEAAHRLLNSRGVWRYGDIVRWKQADVDAVNAAMASPRRVEHEGWIEQAAVLAAGGSTEYSRRRAKGDFASIATVPGAQIAPRPVAAAAPVAAAPAASVAAASDTPQDLTLIRGIDQDVQRLLNGRGVSRFAEIAGWKHGDVDAVNAALSEPRRVENQGWIEQAAVLAAGGSTEYSRRRAKGDFANIASAPAAQIAPRPIAAAAPAASVPAAPSAPQDLTLIRGIDQDAQRLLNGRGVSRFAEIAGWKHGDVDAVNAALSTPRRVENQGWIEQAAVLAGGGLTDYARRRLAGAASAAAEPAPAVGAPAPTPAPASKATAPERHDFTLIRGIDEATARLLNDRGIWRYGDIARWKQAEVDQLNAAMASPRRIEHEGWIEQASVLAAGNFTDYARRRLRGEQLPAHDAVVRAPVRAPAAAPTPPATTAAAAPAIERSPSLAANAVAAAVAAAAAAASRGAAAADRKPAAAAAPAGSPAAATPAAPPATPAAVRVTPAAPVVAPPAAPAQPARPVPVAADMLQRIRGIDAATERLLVANGITRFRQIANWTPGDIEQFDAIVASPGRVQRENWIEQASILAGDGADTGTRPARLADAIRENADRSPRTTRADVGALRSVRSEALKPAAEPGRAIGGARPSGPGDDLKRIRGIGVLIEKKLNALGVSSYHQIANWTVPDIERVSEQLDFRGRIERENWIEQARILSAGGQTEFSRRLDRGEIQ